MKEILTFEQLPQKIQDSLIDPFFSLEVQKFCKAHQVSELSIKQFIEKKITDVAFGSISFDDCITEVSNILELEITDTKNDVLALLIQLFDEETMNIILSYEVNTLSLKSTPETEQNIRKQENNTIVVERDPQIIQNKLLLTLERFNLHIDEKGIVTHEVIRYLQGEISSKDLVPHLTAMLDKPLSEVQTIITVLNAEIFKPLQKQILEEGPIDISHTEDMVLQSFLIPKKTTLPTPEKKPLISFLPKKFDISQVEKSSIASDLKTQGGTPRGTSLFSQEIKKEGLKTSEKSEQKEPPTQTTNPKTYTIDPYREII